MLFGNKSAFAVELETADDCGPLLEGRFCYWIGGKQVGDFDSYVYLVEVCSCFLRSIVGDGGKRFFPSRLSWEEIFEFIRADIYDNETGIWENCPARYEISIYLVVSVYVFLLEDESADHILYGTQRGTITEVALEKGYADGVLEEAYDYLFKMEESFALNRKEERQ